MHYTPRIKRYGNTHPSQMRLRTVLSYKLCNQSHNLNVPMVFSNSSNLHRISYLYLLYLLARYNAPGIMAVLLDLLGLIAENVHFNIHALHTMEKGI